MGSGPPLVQPFQKLVGLFHDGKVCPEVRVHHRVKPEQPQGGDHLSRDRRPRGKPESFAHGGPYRGSRLHHDMNCRIRDGGPDFIACASFRGMPPSGTR